MRLKNEEGGDIMIPHKQLKDRIRQKGYTYRKLSKLLGLSNSALYKKLNGYTEFDIVEAGAISAILDIPPEDIHIFFA